MSKKGKITTEARKGQIEILEPTGESNKARGGAKKQGRYGSVKSRQKLGDVAKFAEALEQIAKKIPEGVIDVEATVAEVKEEFKKEVKNIIVKSK